MEVSVSGPHCRGEERDHCRAEKREEGRHSKKALWSYTDTRCQGTAREELSCRARQTSRDSVGPERAGIVRELV